MNWYRNVERNWEWNKKVAGQKIHKPCCMITAVKLFPLYSSFNTLHILTQITKGEGLCVNPVDDSTYGELDSSSASLSHRAMLSLDAAGVPCSGQRVPDRVASKGRLSPTLGCKSRKSAALTHPVVCSYHSNLFNYLSYQCLSQFMPFAQLVFLP